LEIGTDITCITKLWEMVLSVNGRSLKAVAIIALSLSCCMSVRVAAFSFATPSALRPAAFAQAPQLRRGERASGITALRASDKNAEVYMFPFAQSSYLLSLSQLS
jgi:hypothetical protein